LPNAREARHWHAKACTQNGGLMKTSNYPTKVFLFFCLTMLVVAAPQKKGKAERTDVFGYYFLEGKPSKEFEEIDHLHLSTINEKGKDSSLNGFIRPKKKNQTDYVLVAPKLKLSELSFTTKAVKTISYKFTGKFVRLGDFPTKPPKGTIIEGKLTKLKGAKVVVEENVKFRYEPGG
jgi:hypothetical protein